MKSHSFIKKPELSGRAATKFTIRVPSSMRFRNVGQSDEEAFARSEAVDRAAVEEVVLVALCAYAMSLIPALWYSAFNALALASAPFTNSTVITSFGFCTSQVLTSLSQVLNLPASRRSQLVWQTCKELSDVFVWT